MDYELRRLSKWQRVFCRPAKLLFFFCVLLVCTPRLHAERLEIQENGKCKIATSVVRVGTEKTKIHHSLLIVGTFNENGVGKIYRTCLSFDFERLGDELQSEGVFEVNKVTLTLFNSRSRKTRSLHTSEIPVNLHLLGDGSEQYSPTRKTEWATMPFEPGGVLGVLLSKGQSLRDAFFETEFQSSPEFVEAAQAAMNSRGKLNLILVSGAEEEEGFGAFIGPRAAPMRGSGDYPRPKLVIEYSLR